MKSIAQLLEAVEKEARRAPFPIDSEVYNRAGKDALAPILYAGSLDALVCVFGRDLGKDEVAEGEPLVGAAGRLVRKGLLETLAGEEPARTDRRLEQALKIALLTNTVPYKPPGNKAYADSVKERFRPFIAELLTDHWKGHRVISLGTEAFQWFATYTEPGAAAAFWKLGDERYESELPCTVISANGKKEIVLAPLPHPSPLNQRWYGKFPELLRNRLAKISQ